MRNIRVWAVLAVAGFMAACGGGGGGGDPAPTTVTVTLATSPAGLALTLDGQDAPGSFSDAPGTAHTLAAASPQVLNGRLYEFASWSQGGAATQTTATPSANATWTATFTDRGPTTNRAPGVVLMTVANTGRVGQVLTITGAAQDPDAGDFIAKMQVLSAGVVIAEKDAAPWTLTWTPAAAGVYSLRLRAFDSWSLSKDSGAVDVTIAP